jgi:hypothetical protein
LVFIGLKKGVVWTSGGAGEFAGGFAGSGEKCEALHDFLGEQRKNQRGKSGLVGGLLSFIQGAAEECGRERLAKFRREPAVQIFLYLTEFGTSRVAGGRGRVRGVQVFHGVGLVGILGSN